MAWSPGDRDQWSDNHLTHVVGADLLKLDLQWLWREQDRFEHRVLDLGGDRQGRRPSPVVANHPNARGVREEQRQKMQLTHVRDRAVVSLSKLALMVVFTSLRLAWTRLSSVARLPQRNMSQMRRKLGRTSAHRLAMLRNMVTSLIKHERIRTTVAKAKNLRPYAEKLIKWGKRGTLHDKQLAAAVIREQLPLRKLFEVLGPRYAK